jgi:xylulokinase
VVAFSGDNCNSLVGMGAAAPGVTVISLGTSDTYFAATSEPKTDPNGYGHVFGDSLDGYMTLVCFKNGSLARERVAQKVGYASPTGKTDESGQPLYKYDWDRFSAAIIKETQPGNGGKWMLPYFDPEITPLILNPKVELFGGLSLDAADAPAACRAVVEAQAISMKIHSAWIPAAPKRMLITGGGSQSEGLAQVLADVFGKEMHDLKVPKSAALGAAIRAAICAGGASPDIAKSFAKTGKVYSPNPAAAAAYVELEKRYSLALRDRTELKK